MIASSSSMWQDNKHSVAITYTPTNPADAHKLNDDVTWYASSSGKASSTKGISTLPNGSSGTVCDWKGAGWLRMITARWEIIGFGSVPGVRLETITSSNESKSGEDGVVVLSAFVQKTLFSPQAVSVYVQQHELGSIDGEKLMEVIANMVADLDSEELTAEIGKLKHIPWKQS